MHTIRRMQKNTKNFLKEEEMKKLLFTVLFIVVLLVGGCTTAEVVEPTAEIVEPTAEIVEPTAEIVEPTAEVVEPTAEIVAPTAVPTEETIPLTCPEAGIETAHPEELLIDLGQYGGEVKPSEMSFLTGETYAFILNEQESLMTDGGSISFAMPSLGFVYLHEKTNLIIDGQTWERYGSLAISPKGNFLVPQGTILEIEVLGGIEFPAAIMEIMFVSGQAIPAEDILQLPEGVSYSVRCEGSWVITVENTTEAEIEIPINKYRYMILHPDGVKNVKFSWGEMPQVKTGLIISPGESLSLLPNGSVKLIRLDLYPAK